MGRISAEQAVTIGGKPWRRGDMARVYFSEWPALVGLQRSPNSSTFIPQASVWSQDMPPDTVVRVMKAVDKVWLDVRTSNLFVKITPGVLASADPSAETIKSVVVSGIHRAASRLS